MAARMIADSDFEAKYCGLVEGSLPRIFGLALDVFLFFLLVFDGEIELAKKSSESPRFKDRIGLRYVH